MQVLLLIVQFLLSFCECYIGWKIYNIIFKEKVNSNYFKYVSIIYLLITTLIISINRGIRFYSVLIIIFYILVSTIFLKLVYDVIYLNAFVYATVYFLTVALVDIFVIFIMGLTLKNARFGVIIGRELSWKRILVLFITRIIIAMIYEKVIKDKYENNNVVIYKYNKMILYIAVFEIVGVAYFQMVYSQGDITQLASNWFGFLIISVFFVCVIIALSLYRNMREETKQIKLEKEFLEFNYKSIYKCYQESEEILHDFKTHILIILDMIEKEEKNKAIEYINGIRKPIIGLENNFWLGNSTIDMILNYRCAEARQMNINVVYNINHFNVKDLEVDEGDLCIILDNILSNAIEANDKLKKSERFIELTIQYINEMIIITCKNSFDSSKLKFDNKGKIKSSKQGILHGVGMQSIENIVGKYNGFLKLKHDDSYFFTGITLSM